MTATPLIDRINRKAVQPTPIAERMSPFMRRVAEKRLPVQDRTALLYSNGGGYVRDGTDGAA